VPAADSKIMLKHRASCHVEECDSGTLQLPMYFFAPFYFWMHESPNFWKKQHRHGAPYGVEYACPPLGGGSLMSPNWVWKPMRGVEAIDSM
jgi:hypothetical protein